MLSSINNPGTGSGSLALRESIQRAFQQVGLAKIPPGILSQCVLLAQSLLLSPQQIGDCWEAFSLNRNVRALTDRTFPSFQAELLKEAPHHHVNTASVNNKSSISSVVSVSSTSRHHHFESTNSEMNADVDAVMVVTPAKPPTPTAKNNNRNDPDHYHNSEIRMSRVSLSPAPPPLPRRNTNDSTIHRTLDSSYTTKDHGDDAPTTDENQMNRKKMKMEEPPHPFTSRTNSGQTVAWYEPPTPITTRVLRDDASSSLSFHTSSNASNRYCQIQTSFSYPDNHNNVAQSYRHMFTTVEDRANGLQRHLQHLQAAILQQQQLGTHHQPHQQQEEQQSSTNTDEEDENGRAMMDTSNEDNPAEPGESKHIPRMATWEAVGIPRHEPITCIGRICNAAHEGRINATSVVLEGCRYHSGGQRIAVDLSHMQALNHPYSLFPGQIVAMEGMNPTGRTLIPQRICEGAPAPLPLRTPASQLLQYQYNHDVHNNNNNKNHHTQEGSSLESPKAAAEPLRIVVAAGPFTTSDNLDYRPLMDLVGNVILNRNHDHAPPDVIVLCGPFVDMRQDLVRSGITTLRTTEDEEGEHVCGSYELVFANKISMLLEEMYASSSPLTTNEEATDLTTMTMMTAIEDDVVGSTTSPAAPDNASTAFAGQFILVPSLDDAVAEWVYPQPPLSDRLPNGGRVANHIPGGEGLEIGTLGLHHVETAGRSQTPKQQQRRRVHCVSNPATLQINEMVVGVTSTDILLHLSSEETSAHLPSHSRLNRLCQHLLNQQSYYPLFPGAMHKVNLNWKHEDQWRMPVVPDLLIVPSNLKSFCQSIGVKDEVSPSAASTAEEAAASTTAEEAAAATATATAAAPTTLALNPGRLCMGRSGGTYALVEIHPFPRERLENGVETEELFVHDLPSRTRVEIKRI